VLIVAELALTLVLLAGAGLMMKSFLTLYRLDLGIETAHLLTMRLVLPNQKYGTPELRRAFHERLDQRLAGIGGITAATVTTNMPFGGGAGRQLEIEGRPPAAGEQPPAVTLLSIGPRYFDTIGVRLVRGRDFDAVDGTAGHDSAIVNQRFAAMHFGTEDPIGRRIKLNNDGPTPPGTLPPSWVTIVGIAPTVRQMSVREVAPDPVVYLPLRADAPIFAMLMIRAQRDAATLTSIAREEVRAIDQDLPVFGVFTMDQLLAQQRWAFRIFGSMFAIFAVIALALSAVGLYAVTAYSVAQRTQEIGVRVALGAQAAQVWWLVLRRGIVQMVIGLAIGIGGAIGVGKLLESLLVQTGTRDPATLTSIVALLVFVSLSASFWPARRATRLDPVQALRYE
jgi:predicted permease